MKIFQYYPVIIYIILCISLLMNSVRVGYAIDGLEESHALLDDVLSRHVKNGLVNYNTIAEDKNFQAYIDWLNETNPTSFKNKNDELAFWINAYNAFAIKGVLDRFPVKKMVDTAGFFDKMQHHHWW